MGGVMRIANFCNFSNFPLPFSHASISKTTGSGTSPAPLRPIVNCFLNPRKSSPLYMQCGKDVSEARDYKHAIADSNVINCRRCRQPSVRNSR